jgi:hypothetical protein
MLDVSLTLRLARPAVRRDQVGESPAARRHSAPPPAVAEGAILQALAPGKSQFFV